MGTKSSILGLAMFAAGTICYKLYWTVISAALLCLVVTASVVAGHVPWLIGLIYAGEWLVKLLIITIILDIWR